MCVPIYKNSSSRWRIWGIVPYPERKAGFGRHTRSWVSVFYEQVGQEVRKFVLCTKKLVRLFAVYFSWMKGLDFYPGVLFLWFGKEGEESVVLDVSVFWPEISVWCCKNISKKLSFIFHKVVFTLFGNVISTVFPPHSLWPPLSPEKHKYPPNSLTVLFSTGIFTQCAKC